MGDMLSVFRGFRRLLAALRELVDSLHAVETALVEIAALQREMGPARDRLEALELSRAQFEADMGALVLKAEGKWKAANNAEARERALKKSYERLADDGDANGAEPETDGRGADGEHDAQAREAERLQAMHLGLAPNNKTRALMAKFGL